MGIGKVYLWNYLQRIVNALGALLVVLVMSAFYEVEAAGKFYALYSLLGIVSVFEFGYAILIVQRISKYSNCDFSIVNYDMEREISHYQTVIKFIVIFFVFTYPVLAYLVVGQIFSDAVYIILLLTLALGLSILLSMIGNVIEALGYIEKISKIRTIQAIFSYSALLVALFFGIGATSIFFLLLFQLGVFLILLVKLFKSNPLGFFIFSGFFRYTNLLKFNKNIFKNDVKYSFQIYATVLAGLFSNQIWVIAVTMSGAVEYISKVAMILQIITAAAGFALTPIASRLAEVSSYHHSGSKEKISALISKINRDVIIVTIISIVAVCFLYFIGDFLYPEKIVSSRSAMFFILSLPFLVATSLIGIVIQSGGKKDIVWVSVFRIAIPSLMFFYINENATDIDISIFYFISVTVSFFVAVIYFYKEMK